MLRLLKATHWLPEDEVLTRGASRRAVTMLAVNLETVRHGRRRRICIYAWASLTRDREWAGEPWSSGHTFGYGDLDARI